MAVGVVLDFPGGTLAQYDEVIGKMGLTPGGALPPGGIFHWVTQTADGLRVTDVWESREQFEAFAQEQIGPYTQEVGLPQPQVTFYEVHNHLWRA
jgi:hypothetical protein